MLLRHGVVRTDENVVFGPFDGVRTFPKGGNNVSANGANVKFRFSDVSGAVFVYNAFPGKQFRNRNPKGF